MRVYLALSLHVASIAFNAGAIANQERRHFRSWTANPGEAQNLHAAGFELQTPDGLVPAPWPIFSEFVGHGDDGTSIAKKVHGAFDKVLSLTVEHKELAVKAPALEIPFGWHDSITAFFIERHRLCFFLSLCILLVVLMVGGCQWHRKASSKESHPSDDGGTLAIPRDSNGEKRQGWEAWRGVFKLLELWLNDPECKWRARGLVLLVAVHWVMREASWALIISRVDADAINSITSLHETKDATLVKHTLFIALAWKICLGLPLNYLLDPWVSTWFQVSFQKHCTSRLLTAYFEGGGQAFYRIKMKETQNGIDNPDQRIGQDIEQIAEQIYALYAAVLSAVFGCSMWAVVIIYLGGPILLVIASAMSLLRLAIAYGYFGNRLVVAYQGVLLTAADFRYGLTRVRENAEGVALSSGHALEKQRAAGVFNRHIDAVKHNTWENMLYHSVMGTLAHFPSLILWIFQLSSILSGILKVGDAIRVHQGYDQVTKVLDFLTSNFGTIMVLQANAERLTQLWMACDAENTIRQSRHHSGCEKCQHTAVIADEKSLKDTRLVSQHIAFETSGSGEAFALCGVRVSAPGSAISVGGVRVECKIGEGLLVSGCSGLGKSSVLRALAGLWLDGEGSVRRAQDAEIVYLPQTCYVPIGTLLDVIVYPRPVPDDATDALRHLERAASVALEKALLGPLLARWGLYGESRDWAVVLSSGEKQRLGFARLFLQLECQAAANDLKGVIAILDESTSAVEVATEASLYFSLREYLGLGHLLALASVGHRPTLPRFHERELRIGHDCRPDEEEDCVLPVLEEGAWHCPDGSQLPWQCVQLHMPMRIDQEIALRK